MKTDKPIQPIPAQPVLATTTTPTVEDAERIARRLVEEKLAACVQLVNPIRSVYRWQGKIEEETEVLLLIKTGEPLIPEVKKLLSEIHPYEVPELIAVPITAGSPAYLSWMEENLKA